MLRLAGNVGALGADLGDNVLAAQLFANGDGLFNTLYIGFPAIGVCQLVKSGTHGHRSHAEFRLGLGVGCDLLFIPSPEFIVIQSGALGGSQGLPGGLSSEKRGNTGAVKHKSSSFPAHAAEIF